VAGKLITILPKMDVNFFNINPSYTPPLKWFQIGDTVDARGYTSVGMIVRVHAVNIGGGSPAFINVALFQDGFLDGSGFAFPGATWGAVSVEIFGSPAAPFAVVRADNIYTDYLSLGVQGVSPGSCDATISVDVYLRNPDPVGCQPNGAFPPAMGLPTIVPIVPRVPAGATGGGVNSGSNSGVGSPMNTGSNSGVGIRTNSGSNSGSMWTNSGSNSGSMWTNSGSNSGSRNR